VSLWGLCGGVVVCYGFFDWLRCIVLFEVGLVIILIYLVVFEDV